MKAEKEDGDGQQHRQLMNGTVEGQVTTRKASTSMAVVGSRKRKPPRTETMHNSSSNQRAGTAAEEGGTMEHGWAIGKKNREMAFFRLTL